METKKPGLFGSPTKMAESGEESGGGSEVTRGCMFCGFSFVSMKQEFWTQSKLAWPTIVFTESLSALTVVSMIFIGKLGKEELAAGSLGQSFCNVTGVCIAYGVGSASDTLFAQTYGTKNKKKVGVVLQRSLLFTLLMCLLTWAIYINAEAILIGLQIDRNIARHSASYIHAYSLAVPGVVLVMVISKYLQNQSMVISVMLLTLAANLISVLIHYVFLFVWDLHLVGAAFALSLVWWILGISLIIYIRVRNLHKETWDGWSVECLYDWGMFSKLAVAGVLIIGLEWWAWEIGTFFMGTIGELELAAQGSLFYIAFAVFMIPYAYWVIASIRVGNSLGSNKPDQAKLAALVSLLSISAISIVIAIILLSTKDVLGKIFSNDREILALIGSSVPLVALYQLGDAIGQTCTGVLQGSGLQKIGALVNFITYYIIAIPIMFVLVLVAGFSVQGVWISLDIALAFKAFSLLLCVCRLNWRKQAAKAQKRTHGATLEMVQLEEAPVALLSDGRTDSKISADVNVTEDRSNCNSHAKGGPMSSVDVALIVPTNSKADGNTVSDGCDELHSPECLEDATPASSGHRDGVSPDYTDQAPVKVIIYRRLVSLFSCLTILAVSLLVYLLVDLPPLTDDPSGCTWGNGSLHHSGNITFCNITLLDLDP